MALNIKDAETDRLARELAKLTGETMTTAVRTAVEERLAKVGAHRSGRSLPDEIEEIAFRLSALPVRDRRSPEEILGYGDAGLPR